jgi:cardiolipin synthase A/B
MDRSGRSKLRCTLYFLLIAIMTWLTANGCAEFPPVESIVELDHPAKNPIIIDVDKPLDSSESKGVIEDFKEAAGPTEILEDHLRLMEVISGRPLIKGNSVIILRDGPDTLKSIKQAIRAAENHIHLETFIIRDDKVGRPLTDLLLEKQSQGVKVRMIYDSWGTIKTPRSFFERMKQGGIELYEFNPLNPFKRSGKWTINNRTHRKILVVDGKVAFTGGLNFYRAYAGRPGEGAGDDHDDQIYWRDTQVRIEGPAVAEFQRLFLDMWCGNNPCDLNEPDYFPEPEKKGDVIIRVIAGSPEQPVSHIYAAYMSAILNARRSIYIAQAYFKPDGQMIEAFSRAVQKGVDVKIIVPGESDLWLPIYAGRTTYEKLLKSGVRLFEMQRAMLHAKTAVIDGVWSTVGSTNMNTRGFLHDAEANAVILDTGFAEEMEKMFNDDLAKSNEIFLEEWQNRSWFAKFKESFAGLFAYWM